MLTLSRDRLNSLTTLLRSVCSRPCSRACRSPSIYQASGAPGRQISMAGIRAAGMVRRARARPAGQRGSLACATCRYRARRNSIGGARRDRRLCAAVPHRTPDAPLHRHVVDVARRGISRARRCGSAPAFRAVYRFTTMTIGRSGLHQTVLVGRSGCGLGIGISALLGAHIIDWLRTAGPVSSCRPPPCGRLLR